MFRPILYTHISYIRDGVTQKIPVVGNLKTEILIDMSSFPARSSSTAQEKSEDCHSKAAAISSKRGNIKSRIQSVRTTRNMAVSRGSSDDSDEDDSTTCLYCRRKFSSQRGLSVHLHHCKYKCLLSDPADPATDWRTNLQKVPPLRDCVDQSSLETIVEESDGSLTSDFPACLSSSDCNAGIARTNPVHHHSAESRPTHESERKLLVNLQNKLSIRWPKMTDTTSWVKLEGIVCGQLKDWYSSVDRRIRSLETILYEEAKSMFGTVSSSAKTKFVSRRQKDILTWRRRLNELKLSWKRA